MADSAGNNATLLEHLAIKQEELGLDFDHTQCPSLLVTAMI